MTDEPAEPTRARWRPGVEAMVAIALVGLVVLAKLACGIPLGENAIR